MKETPFSTFIFRPTLHPHPEGEHWVVATLVGQDADEPDVAAVQKELRRWFGAVVDQWVHLTTTTVRHALPHIDPGHHQRFFFRRRGERRRRCRRPPRTSVGAGHASQRRARP